MKRLIKLEVDCCKNCPNLLFIDGGWASHHYMCKSLGISTNEIYDASDKIKAEKEFDNWFKEKCLQEII